MAEVAASMGVDPLQWVLTGGDDHALAACFPPDVVLPESWRIIGRVVETVSDGPRVRLADGSRPSYEDSGWDHFR
jgi:thiamine-monophosphate kinase